MPQVAPVVPGLLAAWTAWQAITIACGAGLCVLTIVLVLIARKRWGNVKTTYKCIWLSVLAHVLLVIYASRTQFYALGTGAGDRELEVPITIVADFDDANDQPTAPPVAESTIPWEGVPLLAAESLQAPSLLPRSESLPEESSVDDEAAEQPTATASIDESAPTDVALDRSTTPEVESPNSQEDNAESVPHAITLGQPQWNEEIDVSESSPSPSVRLAAPQELSAVPNTEPAEFQRVTPARATPRNEIYSLRESNTRRQAALARGGSEQTEAAVNRALEWLVSQQQPDGRWDPRRTEAGREFRVLGHDRRGAGGDADTAITGLALLSLMGAGHSHLQGEYRETVRRGLQFILSSQKSSGHLAGDASLFAHMYSHGIATLAVGEAFALTGDERLRAPLERAVAYSLTAQDPRTGGWRYQPGEEGDMSQFGWQLMALKSAQIGGVNVPTETVRRMTHFVDLCTSGAHSGLGSYRPRQPPTPTMTAEALCCRYFLGQAVPERTADEATRFVVQNLPGSGEVDYYLWYYATLALYQRGGADWDKWNRRLQQQLVETQTRTGEQAGSWEPNGKWCGYGGRVFSTALATMCLEVYYRYLPFVREQVAWNMEIPQR